MKYYKYIDGSDTLSMFTTEYKLIKYQDDTLVSPHVAELLEKIGYTNTNMGRHVPMYNRQDGTMSIEKVGYNGKAWILAPTQAQAQTWLRDVKNTILSVQPIFMDETKTDFKYYFYILGHANDEDEDTYFDIFEEATEYGLTKASNHIKNGKQE